MRKLGQVREIVTRLVDDEAFLVSGTSITHLNLTATLIWTLLEDPLSEKEVCELLCELYPTVSEVQIQEDVSEVINTLRRKHLLSEN